MWVWILGILAVIVAVNVVVLVAQNLRVPELGHTNGQLKALPGKPNNVSTQTTDPAKKVDPWPFKSDLATTRSAVLSAVEQYGGVEILEQTDHYLRVVFTTGLMHFHDDAEFYLDEDDRLVHFRSASRAGHSDMGLNRKRYGQLTDYYQKATEQAGIKPDE